MLQELLNHNEDLRKLHTEGYELGINGGYLIIHHIPYLNGQKELRYGNLIVKLNLSGTILNKPFDHTAYFNGEYPCNIDGTKIQGFVNNSNQINLGNNLTANHYLSNKPISGIEVSYYDKAKRYEAIISRPAEYLFPGTTAKTFKVAEIKDLNASYKYLDTWSSKYDIQSINDKLTDQKIAIIGLGGTGSYILDFIAKTPVKAIHLFDGDTLFAHNAFRAPGAAGLEDLNNNIKKVDYFENIYSEMRNNIFKHSEYITSENIESLLLNFDFVFICIDNNEAKKIIIDFLVRNKIRFIDSGIGLNVVDNKISGTIRTSYCDIQGYESIKNFISDADVNDVYKTNVQVAELNALNATLAIIKWKQSLGFYAQQTSNANLFYSINDSSLIKG